MSLSEPFIRRPVMTVLVMLSALVFGIYSHQAMPVNDLPSVDYPVIQVNVSYPGANPETMASNVATPLEKEFMQIQGLKLITSSSTQGSTSLVLEFNLSRDIDGAAVDVQSAISQATGSLPSDLPSPPTYTKTNPNDMPILYFALTSESLTQGQLYEFASNEIAQRISVLDGVSQVGVYGSQSAVRIDVDPRAIAARNLTMNDIANAVKAGTVSLGAGQLDGRFRTLILKPQGQLSTAEDYRRLIIATRNGAPIRLGDVAVCREAEQDERQTRHFWARGVEAPPASVIIAVSQAAGSNAVRVAQSVKDLVPSIQQTLPGSMQMVKMYDRSDTILASVEDVQETLLIAFGLVVIVIFVFLGRATDTIIPTIALPLSLFLTFIGMRLMHYSLDNLSLMALTLAIGFLVDDAIVFLENCVRRMEGGESPMDAAINGAKEISFTIVSMTLSLAAVFLPLVFMSGLVGRIFQEFAVTIVIAIVASGVVSLTLTPLMCARMLSSRQKGKQNLIERVVGRCMAAVLKVYDSSLDWFLRHGWISILAWIICLAGTVWLFIKVPKTFLPDGDSGFIRGIFIASEDSSPRQMRKLQAQVDDVLRANPNVRMTLTLAYLSGKLPSSQAIVLAFLNDGKRDPIQKVSHELTAALREIPGVIPAIRPNPVLHISTGATSQNQGKYAFIVSGIDTDEVYKSSQVLEEAMRKLPGFSSVSSDLRLNSPFVKVDILRDQASTYGVTASAIENVIRSAYSENYVYLIKRSSDQFQVIVEVGDPYRDHVSDLNRLYVNSTSGTPVPLRAVATTSLTLGPQSVNHVNRFTSVSLFFDLEPGKPIGEATKEIGDLAEKTLPVTLLRGFQGEAQAFDETVRSLAMLMVVAVFVMYVILGILYESYIHPLTVLSALPVATIGGVLTLVVFRAEFSLYAFVGMFMLMGIVKKNGIMMVDFALQEMDAGKDRFHAIKQACLERFRPILMTTLAALMGAVPIAMGYGADGASRKPLGLTIVGGLLVSQLLTLYVTPVIFLYMEAFQEKVLNRIPFFRVTRVPAAPPQPA